MGKKVVIVGAGYSGILAAKKLAKNFKKDKNVSITIVDRNPFSTMLTELHEVAACRVDEASIRMDLKRIFAGRKVEVKLDNIERVDFENKVVIGSHESYEYDYVVIAAGSKPTYFGIEGAQENTYTLWSYDDAVKLRDRIHDVFVRASQEPDLNKRRQLLTFYVVGAGLTGVEMMGELAEYAPILCDKFGLTMKDVTLVEVDALPGAVTTLPEKPRKKIEKRLRKLGVTLKFNTKVIKVTDSSITLDTNGTIEENPVHTVIWTAGIQSADLTADSGDKLEALQRGGRIETDMYLRAKGSEDVFVAGDNAYYVLEGQTTALPQMVENAEQSGKLIAQNITASIRGSKKLTPYKPAFHGTMVCIGGRWGTATAKFGKVQFNMPSFFAMFAKHFMNCVYFMQVLGWNKVFSYLKHEIFTIRNKRSFVGGHFSNRTPSFLLMPIRVWLGMVWLFEGVKKITEGWLDFEAGPKLATFFGGATSWFNGILGIADANAGATGDAVAGATGEAAASAGEILLHLNFFNFIQPMFVSGTALADAKLENLAIKLDFSLMNWFVDNVILSSDGMQFFMQAMVVVMEILIGLALIAGLFTTIAAGMSVILQVMFLMTTGLYLSNFWMFVAGIAVLFAGNTLGLDYWVSPKLKSLWKRIPFIKKWYLYHD